MHLNIKASNFLQQNGFIKLLPVTLLLSSLLFASIWLMYHTFSYRDGTFQISAKVYSDFSSHIPLIRSFSLGSNWPPQYPLYSGEPIKYHFLFYFFVGIIEKAGIPIDHALNIISALGLFALAICIYIYGSFLFSSKKVGLLSVVFFIFNGSFSFLDFLKSHPLSLNSLREIIGNSEFSSFGPWDGSPISAFWNLNIYTNQRHLGFSYAICLIIVIILFCRKDRFKNFVGFLLGSLLLVNQAGFMISFVFLVYSLVFYRHSQKYYIYLFLGFSPWLLLYITLLNPTPSVSIQLGYLLPQGGGFYDFLRYWFLNLGIHTVLIPLGFVFAARRNRVLILCILTLFIVPNIVRLSPDIINNHKLFNFFLISATPFSAFAVLKLTSSNHFVKLLILVISPLTVLGGIFDIFPILNDYSVSISDYPTSKIVSFFVKNTPPNSVVLNDTWIYNPSSLAGRLIFNGYSYFTWSYGYDTVKHDQVSYAIYSSLKKREACKSLINHGINYVQVSTFPDQKFLVARSLWSQQFVPDFIDGIDGVSIYSVKKNCQLYETE
jgi:hypothetical protein